jgi:hypothetical protein
MSIVTQKPLQVCPSSCDETLHTSTSLEAGSKLSSQDIFECVAGLNDVIKSRFYNCHNSSTKPEKRLRNKVKKDFRMSKKASTLPTTPEKNTLDS